MIITGDRVALPVRRPVLFAFLQKMFQLQQISAPRSAHTNHPHMDRIERWPDPEVIVFRLQSI